MRSLLSSLTVLEGSLGENDRLFSCYFPIEGLNYNQAREQMIEYARPFIFQHYLNREDDAVAVLELIQWNLFERHEFNGKAVAFFVVLSDTPAEGGHEVEGVFYVQPLHYPHHKSSSIGVLADRSGLLKAREYHAPAANIHVEGGLAVYTIRKNAQLFHLMEEGKMLFLEHGQTSYTAVRGESLLGGQSRRRQDMFVDDTSSLLSEAAMISLNHLIDVHAVAHIIVTDGEQDQRAVSAVRAYLGGNSSVAISSSTGIGDKYEAILVGIQQQNHAFLSKKLVEAKNTGKFIGDPRLTLQALALGKVEHLFVSSHPMFEKSGFDELTYQTVLKFATERDIPVSYHENVVGISGITTKQSIEEIKQHPLPRGDLLQRLQKIAVAE